MTRIWMGDTMISRAKDAGCFNVTGNSGLDDRMAVWLSHSGFALAGAMLYRADRTPTKDRSMIRHTVVFSLKHAVGSPEEADFLAAARELTTIPTVTEFQALRQVSTTNAYTFGLSMEFADQAAYDVYNRHPDHVAFVRNRWLREVDTFMEIDYVPLG